VKKINIELEDKRSHLYI